MFLDHVCFSTTLKERSWLLTTIMLHSKALNDFDEY